MVWYHSLKMSHTRHRVPAKLAGRLSKARGWPIILARDILQEMPKSKWDWYICVAESQKSKFLHDPQEDTEPLKSLLPIVEREATEIASAVSVSLPPGLPARLQRPLAHLVWHHMKRILNERHGIDWMSIAEMNPNCRFE